MAGEFVNPLPSWLRLRQRQRQRSPGLTKIKASSPLPFSCLRQEANLHLCSERASREREKENISACPSVGNVASCPVFVLRPSALLFLQVSHVAFAHGNREGGAPTGSQEDVPAGGDRAGGEHIPLSHGSRAKSYMKYLLGGTGMHVPTVFFFPPLTHI